jgi:hypothetical protein
VKRIKQGGIKVGIKKASLVERVMRRMGICIECGRKAANETGYCEDCYSKIKEGKANE